MTFIYKFASDLTEGASAAKGSLGNISITGPNGLIGIVSNTLIFLVGALSVIVLIVGGLRYVLSGGNPAQVTSAKNTILYAIVGIVIAVAAYAIVQFVFKQLKVA
jgi:hypothetical protein